MVRPMLPKSLDEACADDRLFLDWAGWHQRLARMLQRLYGGKKSDGKRGLDLFGTDDVAIESRKARVGDILMVQMLKQTAREYHETDDPADRAALVRRMENLTQKIDAWMAAHFDEVPKLYLNVRKQKAKEREQELEAKKLGEQSAEEIEAEVLNMFGGDDAKMQEALKHLERETQ